MEGLGRHQEALGRTRCTRKDRKAPRSTAKYLKALGSTRKYFEGTLRKESTGKH